jgi:hypothetical protein
VIPLAGVLTCIVDPDLDCLAVKAVRGNDKDGNRTIGIITKADYIRQPGNDFVKLIDGSDYTSYKPKIGGWWPVRLRTDEDFEANMSTAELLAAQENMFRRGVWTKLSTEVRRDFSWRTLSRVISAEFEKLVVAT